VIPLAGMPSFDLGEVASLRVEAISFFALVLFASAFFIQKLWNSLRRDFAWLPELSYKKALGLMALWGLLFLLVLTMISGARELLTPGAWKKDGATYKLVPPDESERRMRLESLRAVLWSYASKHGGALPEDDVAPEVSGSWWQVTERSPVRFVYVKGRRSGEGSEPVAFEPAAFGSQRLVLLADGKIELWPAPKLSPPKKSER
jgi:hypothetical protein